MKKAFFAKGVLGFYTGGVLHTLFCGIISVMKKISQKEGVAVGVSIVAVILFLFFSAFGFWPVSNPKPVSDTTNPNNQNTNMQNVDDSQNVTTAGQLLTADEVVGTGAEVTAGKTITVNYKGTLLNGTTFDSSYTRGEPLSIEIGVGKVIQGWDKGLIGMKVGGKRKLVIPPALAYGDQAVGPIPAGSTLVFEVELLDVK